MHFLQNINAVFRRELIRIIHQPMYFILMLVLPVISFAFFAVLFEHGVARDVPIAMLDADQTNLSRTAARMINDTPTAMVAYDIQSMEEGERLMREGKIMAIVQIPTSFEKNILSNRQTNIESYISGTNLTVNGLLSKDIQTAVTTFSAGIQIQLLTKQGLTERQAMAQLMPVRFVRHVLFNPYINYGYYLSPSFMPMMLMIFTIMATIFAFGTELKLSTAKEWIDTANGSVLAAMIGKTLPIITTMFLMSMVMFLIIFKIVGVPLNGSFPFLMLGSLLFLLCYQAIGIFFIAIFSNMRLSLSIGGGYSVLAFTFSGLTFPIMAMSTSMQLFSKIFPFTYYTDLIIDQTLRGAPVIYSLHDIGSMALFLLLPLLVLPRLRTICSDKKYWGGL
ncbi:MAG: ABC transporter permease [Alistipes sp.]